MASTALAQRLSHARRERPALVASAGVFAATLLGFLAIGVVLPVLPRYVRGPVGAGDVAVGVVVGAFAFSAVVGRPVGGRLADVRGRRTMVVVGLLVTAVAGALLLVPAGVGGLVVARLVVGLGDGWVFTAGVTWIVDLAPPDRRTQAIGLFGLAVWGGLTFGSVLGEGILALGSFEAVWVAAALLPAAGALVALRIPDARDRRPDPEPPPISLPRAALAPGVALALANVGYGTMSGFVVLHLDALGVGGGATVFTAFAASVVVTRLLGGRLPDRLGPVVIGLTAFAAQALGLALVALAQGLPVALAGGVVMGFGASLVFPSLAALVVSRTDERRRGAALGAFTAFFDLGVGIGAPLAGAISALAGYPWAFAAAALASLLGGLVALATTRR